MQETDWTREEALVRISECRRRLGISYDDYRKMRMYRYAPENQAAHYEQILKRRAQDRKDRSACIAAAMAEAGWSEEEAITRIKAARDELGISYRDYMDLELYRFAPVNQAARYEKLREKRAQENKERKRCLEAMMKDTGLPQDRALHRIEACRERLGVSYRDYQRLELWKLDRKEQRACYKQFLHRQQQSRKDREACIAAAMNAVGWSEEEAREAVRDCKKRLGISYRDYLALEMYLKSPAAQELSYRRFLEERAQAGEQDAQEPDEGPGLPEDDDSNEPPGYPAEEGGGDDAE